MPQRDVLKSRLDVRPDHAGQAADLFAGNRVPFVRHRGRSFLAGGEGFFRLAHLGTLQVPDFKGNFVKCGGDQTECRDVGGVQIARQHLRGNRGRPQSQFGADQLFGVGSDVGKSADGTRRLSHP